LPYSPFHPTQNGNQPCAERESQAPGEEFKRSFLVERGEDQGDACAKWFFRNVFRRCLVVLVVFVGMCRCTSASEMSKPAFCSLPCMRGAPQSGLSFAICLMKSICACGIFGLPTSDRLFRLQYNLKPCRCHRMTVSGSKTNSASFPSSAFFPRVEDIDHHAEEGAIGRPQSGSGGSASEYFYLLSQKRVLEPNLSCN
jgi:hypothetical protein